jgi:hypothetical protein
MRLLFLESQSIVIESISTETSAMDVLSPDKIAS